MRKETLGSLRPLEHPTVRPFAQSGKYSKPSDQSNQYRPAACPKIVGTNDCEACDEEQCAIEVDVRAIGWAHCLREDAKIHPFGDSESDEYRAKQAREAWRPR